MIPDPNLYPEKSGIKTPLLEGDAGVRVARRRGQGAVAGRLRAGPGWRFNKLKTSQNSFRKSF